VFESPPGAPLKSFKINEYHQVKPLLRSLDLLIIDERLMKSTVLSLFQIVVSAALMYSVLASSVWFSARRFHGHCTKGLVKRNREAA